MNESSNQPHDVLVLNFESRVSTNSFGDSSVGRGQKQSDIGAVNPNANLNRTNRDKQSDFLAPDDAMAE